MRERKRKRRKSKDTKYERYLLDDRQEKLRKPPVISGWFIFYFYVKMQNVFLLCLEFLPKQNLFIAWPAWFF